MAKRDLSDRPVAYDSASGSEESVYRARARRLGLPFTLRVVLSNPEVTPEAIARGAIARSRGDGGPAYIAPAEDALPAIQHWLSRYAAARRQLCVSTPTAIRAALRRARDDRIAAVAFARLENIDPAFSARRVATPSQLLVAGALAAILVASLLARPGITLAMLNLVAAAFFFGIATLRFIAAALPGDARRALARDLVDDDRELPIYTVLVPLYREANVVPELVDALEAIAWPADRLDIKLIVEADDMETRRAVEWRALQRPFETIVVPRGEPRTKPRALSFALATARGSLVTTYDAEDRPHPYQLREAHNAFCRADAGLACLQAPIVINNPRASWFAKLFAIEYSTLFDGLLPALVALRLPLPLGGTSNHFRREALEKVGAWDPFNVTEDADLGIRLVRFGYRSATLVLPTYEEAPTAFGPWIRQRTRWFKGWLQTWLVHMRQPLRLWRELGLRQLLGFNLMSLGMIVAALAHPIFLATVLIVIMRPLSLWADGDPLTAAIVGIDLFNLVAGYLAVALLARKTLALRGRRRPLGAILTLPVYWLMMTLAACRALYQLVARPHHWEKTPHKGSRADGRTRRSAIRQPATPATQPRANAIAPAKRANSPPG